MKVGVYVVLAHFKIIAGIGTYFFYYEYMNQQHLIIDLIKLLQMIKA